MTLKELADRCESKYSVRADIITPRAIFLDEIVRNPIDYANWEVEYFMACHDEVVFYLKDSIHMD